MTRPANIMSPDEAAIRAALNVLRDTVESGHMPSGLQAATCTSARLTGSKVFCGGSTQARR